MIWRAILLCLKLNSVRLKELKERQSWSLNQKIDHSLSVIERFYKETDGKCYVSFSGGKDSCVLKSLCQILFPDILNVFCNTRNEYPEIVSFVRKLKEHDNIQIIYPDITPKQVFETYGFPLISKKISQNIYRKKCGFKTAEIPQKYKFLFQEKFDCSNLCCEQLKKEPFKKFESETGLHPIIGIMAEESDIRTMAYLRHGNCNFFEDKRVQSWPLAIWTEKDIWEYINKFNIEISAIYYSGLKRTGCALCGFGAQIGVDNRLEFMYKNHRKAYETYMLYQNNGVTYREALTKVLAANGHRLPDNDPENITNLIDFSL